MMILGIFPGILLKTRTTSTMPCLRLHAPVKRRRVKGTPLPWVNSQISDTMKERDWAHRKARKSNSARHWSMYAKLRNKVNGLVRTAKSNL